MKSSSTKTQPIGGYPAFVEAHGFGKFPQSWHRKRPIVINDTVK